MTHEVEVIEEPKRAQVLLQQGRIDLLEQLTEPASAAVLARKLGLPRQRLNYHLRELEAQRLIELVEEKQKGNVKERIYRRTGHSYAISPAALGPLGSGADDVQDRFSSAYQIARASQVIREVSAMRAGASAAKKSLATFAVDVDVRFASAEQRN